MATLTLDQKTLPTVPVDASEAFLEALIDLFKVKIRNDNTRYAYKHALERFTSWATRQQIAFEDVRAGDIADYIDEIGQTYAVTTVKQHLAILRRFFAHLEMAGVMDINPAASVPSPKFKRHTGATPYLTRLAKAIMDLKTIRDPETYPDLERYDNGKEKTHSQFAICLQNLEARIMLDGACEALRKQEIFCYTIHDAIGCQSSQVSTVRRAIKDATVAHVGYEPVLSWS